HSHRRSPRWPPAMRPTPQGKSARCYRSQIGGALPSLSCLLREFPPPINQHKKRLPDRSEPWASGVCQANLLHLLLKIASSNFIFISETRHQLGVSGRKFFLRAIKRLVPSLLNALRRTNFVK